MHANILSYFYLYETPHTYLFIPPIWMNDTADAVQVYNTSQIHPAVTTAYLGQQREVDVPGVGDEALGPDPLLGGAFAVGARSIQHLHTAGCIVEIVAM